MSATKVPSFFPATCELIFQFILAQFFFLPTSLSLNLSTCLVTASVIKDEIGI